ncbi:MAG: hypothetical protein JW801_09135, partial [Bacteroidales bacterium]|nr:hypothetical protein [Bacteroidales bacterium]
MMKRFFTGLLFSALFTLAGRGMDDLQFTHLTTRNGLSDNVVFCIYQDHKGFMWFGTNDGLNVYDGYEFTLYKYSSVDKNSLSGNSVFGIHEDQKGNIWIAGSSGVDIYESATRSFRHIPFFEEGISDQYESYTRAIMEDNQGNVVIANTNGIFRYDVVRGGFVRHLKNLGDIGVFDQAGIRSMLVDKENRIWVGMIGTGLYGYDLNGDSLIVKPSDALASMIPKGIWALAEDEEGNIWAGTEKGVFILDSKLTRVRKLEALENLSNEHVRNIRDLAFDGRNLWIGTDGGGLLMYNRDSEELRVYSHQEKNPNSLNSNSVRAIMRDRQGLLWVGTFNGGLNFTQVTREKRFENFRKIEGEPNSLINNNVSALFEDSNGYLWIGTDGGGLDRYDRKKRLYRHYVHEPDKANTIGGNAILCITEDNKGRIWLGGYLSGIDIIDPSTGLIKSYRNDPENPNSLSNNDVRDILIENDTAVWVATNGGGLDLFNPKAKTFTHFTEHTVKALCSDWCLKLFRDSRNRLWLGTYDGITRIDPSRKVFTTFTKGDEGGGLSNEWIYAFAEDTLGNIWVGTANGLNLYDSTANKFNKFNTRETWPNEVINGILVHHPQDIWLSTNKGLVRLNPNSRQIHVYDELDGLQGDQFIHGSYFMNASGEMFFGGTQGFNIFMPDSVVNNTFRPPVYLTDLLLFFREVPIGGKNSPLQKSLTETRQIKLSHEQSVITFKYTGLNFINPGRNQYAYMLEGLDDSWNYVGTRREATYTNLSPGTYVFRVKACNNDGVWNDQGASLTVVVLPPWWETIYFRITAILLLILFVVTFYFYRMRVLRNQKNLLESQVAARTHEVNEKNRLLQQQTSELSRINSLLEDRSSQIEKQAEGLAEANTLLEERQQQIEEQTEELVTQKEELEQVNEHLQELNSTKDKFFSIIAHDLKNPFNTILGFSELLSKNYESLTEEKKRHFADIIFKSTMNVYNLLENLLQWSRSQTNRLKFEPAELDIVDMIKENLALLRETYKSKNISIVTSLKEGSKVYADKNMVNTVIRNLLSNAIKFTNVGGSVKIEVKHAGDQVKISVIDNGIGIPEKEQDRLFQVDSAFTREGTAGEGGTGLGLILCKEYIQKHGGYIMVESNEGAGSAFSFTLPFTSG